MHKKKCRLTQFFSAVVLLGLFLGGAGQAMEQDDPRTFENSFLVKKNLDAVDALDFMTINYAVQKNILHPFQDIGSDEASGVRMFRILLGKSLEKLLDSEKTPDVLRILKYGDNGPKVKQFFDHCKHFIHDLGRPYAFLEAVFKPKFFKKYWIDFAKQDADVFAKVCHAGKNTLYATDKDWDFINNVSNDFVKDDSDGPAEYSSNVKFSSQCYLKTFSTQSDKVLKGVDFYYNNCPDIDLITEKIGEEGLAFLKKKIKKILEQHVKSQKESLQMIIDFYTALIK